MSELLRGLLNQIGLVFVDLVLALVGAHERPELVLGKGERALKDCPDLVEGMLVSDRASKSVN